MTMEVMLSQGGNSLMVKLQMSWLYIVLCYKIGTTYHPTFPKVTKSYPYQKRLSVSKCMTDHREIK